MTARARRGKGRRRRLSRKRLRAPTKLSMEGNDHARARNDDERHICCSMTSVLLRLVRSECGDALVADLLREAGSTRGAAYLENLENWISLSEAMALLEAGTRLTGDQHF